MPKFSPKPGDTVVIFSQRFTFQELPQAPGMVFSSEGAKGFVYQVRSDDGTRYGLKPIFYTLPGKVPVSS